MGYKHQKGIEPPLYRHDPQIAHDLKSWVGNFQEIFSGDRVIDHRVMDRDFQVGDIIRYHEFDPMLRKFTGRECDAEITLITPAFQHHPAVCRLVITLV